LLISAFTGFGLAELKDRITRFVEARQTEVALRLPVGEGRWLAFVEERGKVLEREYGPETVRLRALLKPEDAGRVARFVEA
jgi:50S ribosomal subunit-associated GTPase HflX